MLTVAYLANQFPSAVEPYVIEEIEKLQSRGIRVIAASVRAPCIDHTVPASSPEVLLKSVSPNLLLRAFCLCLHRWKEILPLIGRILFQGHERPLKRVKALAHTWLGACYALLLQGRGVDHIHVHHGYFGSWIGMVAARLLGSGFSMTLHGSDLLLHATYLDVKLQACTFCSTVSEYNRRHILERYPGVSAEKVIVARMGVEMPESEAPVPSTEKAERTPLRLLAVGRLHSVKNHAFLIRACAQLRSQNVPFECTIAGDGPEWHNLQMLIREWGLETQVILLGHIAREHLDSWYDGANVVVLTSRSEGVPLVLMEAMARGKIVLAPAITGIPELVIAGKTGFLYEAGSLEDFVSRLLFIDSLMRASDRSDLRPYILSEARQLDWIRREARHHVRQNFNRSKNLETFGDMFLRRIASRTENIPHEDFILQQI
jgi:glycosyltransferase involved in cell wall biosynthesis